MKFQIWFRWACNEDIIASDEASHTEERGHVIPRDIMMTSTRTCYMEDLTPAGHELLRLMRSESGVLSLQLQAGENRINRPMVDALHAALQVVEQRAHPKALIVSSSGKFFMNGLDLAWMSEHPDDAISVVADFWKLLARILTLDCHTVTHTLAGATQGRVFLLLREELSSVVCAQSVLFVWSLGSHGR